MQQLGFSLSKTNKIRLLKPWFAFAGSLFDLEVISWFYSSVFWSSWVQPQATLHSCLWALKRKPQWTECCSNFTQSETASQGHAEMLWYSVKSVFYSCVLCSLPVLFFKCLLLVFCFTSFLCFAAFVYCLMLFTCVSFYSTMFSW